MTRRRDRASRTSGLVAQPPFRQLRRHFKPIEILSTDHLMAIHDTALTILEEIGMKVLSERARALYAQGGADVETGSDRVRFGRAMVMDWLARAPDSFTLAARDPAKTVKVGGADYIFSSVGGPAYVCDIERGRRPGTYAEQCDYMRLIQSLNILHQEGGAVFNLTLHPWLTGQAHRIRYLRDALRQVMGKPHVWRGTTDQLADTARRQLT